MIERLRILAVPVLLAVAALFAGLQPTLLATGRIAPLDWLVPEGGALIAMMILAKRGGRSPGKARGLLYLALVVMPPLLLCILAATRLAWAEMLGLPLLLALVAGLIGTCLGRSRAVAAGTVLACLAGLVAVQALVSLAGAPLASRAAGPRVAVMSALPLFRDHRAAGGPLDVGGRSPLLQAMGVSPEPVDRLDGGALSAFDRLLLVQPRLLRPEELVALDAWVRAGGHVTILADPLLHWSDGRSPGDPGRAPLTSLLDPLFTHWGLTLEPANARAGEERRVLAGGGVLQLVGASRFTLAKGAPCRLEEQGLIARCRIGEGEAALVADADWIDDALWTQDPTHPLDERSWTSEGVRVLEGLVAGRRAPFHLAWPWLISQDALISGLRWALGLVLVFGVLLAAKGPIPISTHDRPVSKPGGKADSGEAFPESG